MLLKLNQNTAAFKVFISENFGYGKCHGAPGFNISLDCDPTMLVEIFIAT